MGETLLALALEGPAQAFLSSWRGSLSGLWPREVRLQGWQEPRKGCPLLREAPAAWGMHREPSKVLSALERCLVPTRGDGRWRPLSFDA